MPIGVAVFQEAKLRAVSASGSKKHRTLPEARRVYTRTEGASMRVGVVSLSAENWQRLCHIHGVDPSCRRLAPSDIAYKP